MENKPIDDGAVSEKKRAMAAFERSRQTSADTKQEAKTKKTLNHEGQLDNVFVQWEKNGAYQNMYLRRIISFNMASNVKLSEEEILDQMMPEQFELCKSALLGYLRTCAEVVRPWTIAMDIEAGQNAPSEMTEQDLILEQMRVAVSEDNKDLVAELQKRLLECL